MADSDYTDDEIGWFRSGERMFEATNGADDKPLCTSRKPESVVTTTQMTRQSDGRREGDKPANPPNPKQRFGDMKAAVHLVPPALQIHAAKAYKEGAEKYGAFNWRVTKVESMTYIAGMMRHLMAYLDGEEIDPESSTGKHHLDGVAASLGILLDAMDGGFLVDNRPPKGPAPGLLRMPVTK